jgi:hypothetical protein
MAMVELLIPGRLARIRDLEEALMVEREEKAGIVLFVEASFTTKV